MKVIFLTYNGFIRQHLTDMYVESIAKNYPIELWDLSPIYQRDKELNDSLENRRLFYSLDEFDSALQSNTEKIIIITNILFYAIRKFYPIIKKYEIDLVTITKEGLTSYLFDRNWLSLKTSLTLKDIAKHLIKNIFPLRWLINRFINRQARFDYLLAANNFFPEYSRHFVKIHHVKYDEFIRAQNSFLPAEKPYAVFLDSGVTTHPMYKNKNLKNIDEHAYINALNKYFDFVEREYAVNVIISAHPKSIFDPSTFNGRPIIQYQTPALIQHCEFVLSHFSTSVVNAILGFKPLLFLTSQAMMKSAQRFVAIGGIEYAKELRSPIVDVDQPQKHELTVDRDAYQKFINRFVINPECSDQTNETIILEFLRDYERSH